MRKIKLRGWDGEQKRFVYWSLNDFLCRFGEAEYKDDRKDCSPLFDWSEFTGLLDKNGKEIYEGDLVKFTLKDGQIDRIEVAKFEFGTFHPLMAMHLECKVIGNIYENPDLIN